MASLRLRDRDAIITEEGLIFRVFGYSHPSSAYVCDAEYAPAEIFKPNNPKAFRNSGKNVFYKFYEDEGWKFIFSNFSQYTFFHEMLNLKIVGIKQEFITETRKPIEKLQSLVEAEPKDELQAALQSALDLATHSSGSTTKNFGVFGSLLHGFYHPQFSDIDLIVYGGKIIGRLRETLRELYSDTSSPLKNEFETDEAVNGKVWHFTNYSVKEFLWHQKRKLIYGLFKDEKSGRTIKTEFEPGKEWEEIVNEYDPRTRIVQKSWVKLLARVLKDDDAPFIPSIYEIEPLKILSGPREATEVTRIVTYMEEFRLQGQKDETIYAEGNLEEVANSKDSFFQIALTYCPRYYEQVLKVASSNLCECHIV